MFDIGFTEMMFIAVVALVVIGPERLPKVTRTLGHLFGRAQRYVTDVKSEINREMEIEDLRKMQAEMKAAASSMESEVRSSMRQIDSEVRKETSAVQAEMDELKADLDERTLAEPDPTSKPTQQRLDDGQALQPADSQQPVPSSGSASQSTPVKPKADPT